MQLQSPDKQLKTTVYSLAFFLFFSGLLIGYELSKWTNMDNYEPSLLNGLLLLVTVIQISRLFIKLGNVSNEHRK